MSQVYDPKANAVNAIRLVLATAVIFWHSFPLTGRDIAFHPLRQLSSEIWVDGFFTISGFLITGSWIRRPHVWAFLKARILRIFPAFWVCLAMTAFVAAPIGVAFHGGHVGLLDSVRYVFQNSLLTIHEYGINGSPLGVPSPGAWNGSLWTLRWEFLCYLGVVGLGVTGLLKRRFTITAVAAGAWILALLAALGPLAHKSIPDVTKVLGTLPFDDLSRFGLMFAAGALIHQLADKLPVSWRLVGAAYLVVVLSSLLPDYRLAAAPFLAYALIGTGALLKRPRLHLRNDISYGVYIYAFPIQQLLAGTGLATLPPLVFGLLAALLTAPLAMVSWFVVEKPSLSLKDAQLRRQSMRKEPVQAPPLSTH